VVGVADAVVFVLAVVVVLVTSVVEGLELDVLVVFGAEVLVDVLVGFVEDVLEEGPVEPFLIGARCCVSSAHIRVI
jgi:hypothetical protein